MNNKPIYIKKYIKDDNIDSFDNYDQHNYIDNNKNQIYKGLWLDSIKNDILSNNSYDFNSLDSKSEKTEKQSNDSDISIESIKSTHSKTDLNIGKLNENKSKNFIEVKYENKTHNYGKKESN